MRHGKKVNHLGRKKAHRDALLSNLASSLLINKRIMTTVAKAKALRDRAVDRNLLVDRIIQREFWREGVGGGLRGKGEDIAERQDAEAVPEIILRRIFVSHADRSLQVR